MKLLYIVLSLVILSGCNTPKKVEDAQSVQRPQSVQRAQTVQRAQSVQRVGFLPKMEDEHPLVVETTVGEGHQAYLDLVENGERTDQIIVVYPINMEQPQDHDRLVEIKGKLHHFKAIKPKTTPYKQTFDCEVVEVLEWKYRD